MFYSLVNDVKEIVVKFFRYLFFENERGTLKFTNGTRRIRFSKPVIVKESYNWEIQEHPAVLVDTAVGKMVTLSISQDFLGTSEMEVDGERKPFLTFGGASLLTVTISCIAKSKEERDNLVDICAIYLSRPDAKKFFLQHGMDLPHPVTITNEATIRSPNTDFQLYQTDLTLEVQLQWEEMVDPEFTISDVIISNVEYDLDPPEEKVVLNTENKKN